MNLDKSKIETMLFETAERLQLNLKEPEIYYDHIKINVTKTYTYLGRSLDVHLNLSKNFEKKYQRTSSKCVKHD